MPIYVALFVAVVMFFALGGLLFLPARWTFGWRAAIGITAGCVVHMAWIARLF